MCYVSLTCVVESSCCTVYASVRFFPIEGGRLLCWCALSLFVFFGRRRVLRHECVIVCARTEHKPNESPDEP